MTFYSLDEETDVELGVEPLPQYSEKGFIEIEILHVSASRRDVWRYEVEEIELDLSSSVFWIQEGVGIEFWCDSYLDLDLPGKYRIEGIHGEYYRGDWSAGEDDDEEWFFDKVMRIE